MLFIIFFVEKCSLVEDAEHHFLLFSLLHLDDKHFMIRFGWKHFLILSPFVGLFVVDLINLLFVLPLQLGHEMISGSRFVIVIFVSLSLFLVLNFCAGVILFLFLVALLRRLIIQKVSHVPISGVLFFILQVFLILPVFFQFFFIALMFFGPLPLMTAGVFFLVFFMLLFLLVGIVHVGEEMLCF